MLYERFLLAMKLNKTKKRALSIFCMLTIAVFLSLSVSGAGYPARVMEAEGGMVSDDGEHMPLTPEAGTVEGTGDGMLGDASSAFDDFSQGVSDAVSDVLDMNGSNSDQSSSNASNTGTGTTSSADGEEGGSVAAAVIICIIIAIAVIILVIVLIPKKKD